MQAYTQVWGAVQEMLAKPEMPYHAGSSLRYLLKQLLESITLQ
jgi:hypothetical protein